MPIVMELRAHFLAVQLAWIGSSLRLDPAGTADTADDLAAFLPPSSAIARELPWQAYLLRIAAGDQAALSALFDETSPLVFAVALRILSFRADAEEIVVDVYSQVWRTAAKYDANRGPVRIWLGVLARTRAFDYLRSRRAQIFTADFAPPTHTAPNPENIAADAQLCGRVCQALEILPCEQRRAIEIACQLNEPVAPSRLAFAWG